MRKIKKHAAPVVVEPDAERITIRDYQAEAIKRRTLKDKLADEAEQRERDADDMM